MVTVFVALMHVCMYVYVCKGYTMFSKEQDVSDKVVISCASKMCQGWWVVSFCKHCTSGFGSLRWYFLDYNSSNRSWSWSSVTVPIGLLVTLLINPVTEFGNTISSNSHSGFKLFSFYSGNAPESSWKPIKAPETIKALETFLYPCPYLYIKTIYPQTPVGRSSMTWCLVWHAL